MPAACPVAREDDAGTSIEDLLALKLQLGHALSLTDISHPLQESQIWFSGNSIFRAKQIGIGDSDSASSGSSCSLLYLAEQQGNHDCEQMQQLRALQRRLALALAGIHPPRSRQVCFAMAPCASGLVNTLMDNNLKERSDLGLHLSTSQKACR